jgi:hypothetical protein
MLLLSVTAPELRGLWFYFKELANSGDHDDEHINSA